MLWRAKTRTARTACCQALLTALRRPRRPAPLQRAASRFATETLVSRVIPALEELGKDEDVDVLGAAREALEICAPLVHAK